MEDTTPRYPICDLHCDLLSYLAEAEGAAPDRVDDIGCAIPHLAAGNVKLQVLAMYTAVESESVASVERQVTAFENMIREHENDITPVTDNAGLDAALAANTTGMVVSIESASGLCTEDGDLDTALAWLEQIIERTGRVLYLSLTHADENRFGGGNASWVGLKPDGKALLEYINGRGIAIDLSHACDPLAGEIFEHIERRGLELPVLASHSNFRSVYTNTRNLPDEFAIEIIRRDGLIGSNFMREFLNPEKPEALIAHLEHGLEIGGEQALCFGADYFHVGNHPDQSRLPFYFPEHRDARCYQNILADLEPRFGHPICERIACQNTVSFIRKIWD